MGFPKCLVIVNHAVMHQQEAIKLKGVIVLVVLRVAVRRLSVVSDKKSVLKKSISPYLVWLEHTFLFQGEATIEDAESIRVPDIPLAHQIEEL